MNIHPKTIEKILSFSVELKAKVGDRLITIRDLCKKHSISPATVEAMKLLGYIAICSRGAGGYFTNYVLLETCDARKIIVRRQNYNTDTVIKNKDDKFIIKELSKLSSFTDQQLILELRNRGYQGDIQKKAVI